MQAERAKPVAKVDSFCMGRYGVRGLVGGYARVRREVEAKWPDRLYAVRKGSIDFGRRGLPAEADAMALLSCGVTRATMRSTAAAVMVGTPRDG